MLTKIISTVLAAVVVASLSGAQAQAATCQGQDIGSATTAGCTKSFYFSGTCNGQDQNPVMQSGGFTGVLITPWEPGQIEIDDVAIVFMPNRPPTFYAFAGNSDTPDIMTWLTSDGTESHIPHGMTMRFSQGHIDLHIWCLPSNTPYQGFYTVYYLPG